MTTTADWPSVHAKVIEAFAEGWRVPGPDAWDGLIAPDVVLTQPLLPECRGREAWHEEMERLLELAPDLTGEVLSWSGSEDVVFIELMLRATVRGRPLVIRAVDVLRVEPPGLVVRRDSYFDPAPVATTLLRLPSSWLTWWRSGVGPLLGRRRLLTR